jgi:hypothetical protein
MSPPSQATPRVFRLGQKGDFSNVVSLQCAFTWDSDVLSYWNVRKFGLPGLSNADFSYSQPSTLYFTWADPSGLGVSRAEGVLLFELCFIAKGETGSASPINSMCWPGTMSDSGSVSITNTSSIEPERNSQSLRITLAPNPSAQQDVLLKAELEAPGAVFVQVIDPLGREVYAQAENCEAGLNLLQLPSSAFASKGVHYVLLQTKVGAMRCLLMIK